MEDGSEVRAREDEENQRTLFVALLRAGLGVGYLMFGWTLGQDGITEWEWKAVVSTGAVLIVIVALAGWAANGRPLR